MLLRFYSSDAELARLFKSVNGLILPVSSPDREGDFPHLHGTLFEPYKIMII